MRRKEQINGLRIDAMSDRRREKPGDVEANRNQTRRQMSVEIISFLLFLYLEIHPLSPSPPRQRRHSLVPVFIRWFVVIVVIHSSFLISFTLLEHDRRGLRRRQHVVRGLQRQVDETSKPALPVVGDAVLDGGAGVEEETLTLSIGKMNHQRLSTHRFDADPIHGNHLQQLERTIFDDPLRDQQMPIRDAQEKVGGCGCR